MKALHHGDICPKDKLPQVAFLCFPTALEKKGPKKHCEREIKLRAQKERKITKPAILEY